MGVGLLGGIKAIFFPAPEPRSLVTADIGDELVVRGRILPRDLIESPLSGERCVYYSYTVDVWQEAVQGLGGDGHWRNVERDEAITEFYLQTDDERVIVAPASAEVTRSTGPKMRDVPYTVIGRRAGEMLLVSGNEVEIRGVLAAADDLYDDARDYRASPRRLMLTAPDEGTLSIRLLK